VFCVSDNWRSVDALLGRGRTPPSSFIDAESFNKFFVDKVTKVRDATNDAPLPEFTARRPNAALRGFCRISADDVINAVRRLPDKSSVADPIPTFVLKRIVGLIAPYIVELFNRSLEAGQFPICFKEAYITPILKKPGLDSTEVGSYRPISNLPVLSKLLERLVAGQLNNYLSSADLLPPLQSGFRPNYSTETAVLRVLSDILLAVDRGDFAALTLLDLTAAFDTVDHGILLQRLRITFGIDDVALKWFRSYLLGRTQRVCRGVTRSSVVQLVCGLPQGSVLGPILFILYTADLVALIERLGLTPHLYADDIQIYGACSPSGTDLFLSEISNCAVDVAAWLRSNRLQMNDAKTEFMWFTTCRRLHRLPTSGPAFGSVSIPPSTAVRDLGIFVDSDRRQGRKEKNPPRLARIQTCITVTPITAKVIEQSAEEVTAVVELAYTAMNAVVQNAAETAVCQENLQPERALETSKEKTVDF
jgi:hypothetical protein